MRADLQAIAIGRHPSAGTHTAVKPSVLADM